MVVVTSSCIDLWMIVSHEPGSVAVLTAGFLPTPSCLSTVFPRCLLSCWFYSLPHFWFFLEAGSFSQSGTFPRSGTFVILNSDFVLQSLLLKEQVNPFSTKYWLPNRKTMTFWWQEKAPQMTVVYLNVCFLLVMQKNKRFSTFVLCWNFHLNQLKSTPNT